MSVVVLQGNTRRLRATFKDVNGALFDGTTVKLLVQDGHGAKTEYTYGASSIVRESLGVYHFDLVLNVPGTWAYTWHSEGNVYAAGKGYVTVQGQ